MMYLVYLDMLYTEIRKRSNMKKKICTLLGILILSTSLAMAYSKPINKELSNAIQLYKSGNYSACYDALQTIIKHDSSNALSYYYMAMTSAQIGKKDDAIANYERALALTPSNSILHRYAKKGKICLMDHEKCNDDITASDIEKLMKNPSNFSDEARGMYEQLKIENMMREINKDGDIDPGKFKDYKDFSSMKNEKTPSNDEIVEAMRTLQRAGFGNILNNQFDLSLLTGNNRQNPMLEMMGTSALSPQVIQTLLNSNMSFGF